MVRANSPRMSESSVSSTIISLRSCLGLTVPGRWHAPLVLWKRLLGSQERRRWGHAQVHQHPTGPLQRIAGPVGLTGFDVNLSHLKVVVLLEGVGLDQALQIGQ